MVLSGLTVLSVVKLLQKEFSMGRAFWCAAFLTLGMTTLPGNAQERADPCLEKDLGGSTSARGERRPPVS